MKLKAILQRRLGWMNLSTATLVALLQRTPVLQLVASADEYVASSPIGTLLKSAVAAVVGLGAIDSMAGATVLSDSVNTITSGTLPSINATAGTPITMVGFTITNTQNVASWTVTGDIPPGLMLTTVEPNGGSLTMPGNLDATTPGTSGDGWSPGTTGNNTTTPVLKGTPTTAGTFTFNLQGFAEPGEKGGNGGTFVGTGISAVFPVTVVVAPAAGTTTNPPPATAPVFTTQPVSVTVTGGPVALDALATGATSYQWMWNGSTPVSGATDATLLIPNASAAAGSYTCVATNSGGSTTSNAATITVTSTANVGRMVNISARSSVGTGGSIIFGGFAVGGGSGTLPLLIRASGPALIGFGVAGTLPDPMLQMFDSTGAAIAGDLNTGWAGNAQISADASAVGAFAWTTPTSHDAGLDLPFGAGSYTAQVSGESGDTGVAIMEVYDATPMANYSTTPIHLTNLSARVLVGAGSNALFAGFVIKGDTAMTVLIRASGPALQQFGVGGTISDPQLTLQFQSSGATIASNAGWGGDTQIASTAQTVGGFKWTDPTSKDSALLITLPPGNYTANVAGASGDTGVAIVEVYEVQ
jgi:hypothetical protein